MALDEYPEALPKLVGSPAYSRPPALITAPRPFDPDELPLESDQTDEERAFAAGLPARAYAPGGAGAQVGPMTSQANQTGDATTSSAPPPSKGVRGIGRLLGRR
jgi:hypothetical protein